MTEHQTAFDSAEQALAEARATLREAEARVADAEQQVGRHAQDPVLFRLVQKRLLEDGDLEDVAIVASVDEGVVTLSGQVPDANQRDRAVELARSIPGVVSVDSRIHVAAATPEG